jgi:hypothetical protein
LGTLVMVVVMSITGKTLKTPETPSGIIALELAGTKTKVQKVFTAWGFPTVTTNSKKIGGFRSMASVFDHGNTLWFIRKNAARTNTYYDFIFIFFYTSLFYMLCKATVHWLNNHGHTTFSGIFLSKAVIVSAFLDIIENTGMLISLSGNISDTIAAITFIASIIKWSIVAITILYLLIFGIYFGFLVKRK